MRSLLRLSLAVFASLVPSMAFGQEQTAAPPAGDYSAHQPAAPLPPFIPPVADVDRAAAFPDVGSHEVHATRVNYFVLFDEVEWQAGDGTRSLHWDAKGWIGKDRDRLWFRTEGEGRANRLEHAQAQVLYGRAFSRWWDVVVGMRHDEGDEPRQTWAAAGVQGLAPYWFDVKATAYLGTSGQTHVRLETEYDLLVTNRLMLRPLLDVDIHGKSDPNRSVGAGLSSVETGVRLRYELRRELAPYVGVVWTRLFFGTADYAEAAGEPTSGVGLIIGVRFWL